MSLRAVVVGAGPSGCSAATVLARAGFEVILVDKGERGRDKVCGDALIPDAFAALEALGCVEQALASAHAMSRVRILAPNHAPLDLKGRVASLPRAQLDAVLLSAAEAAGAQFRPGLSFAGLQERSGRVVGVRLVDPGGEPHHLQADHVLLATGASAGPLHAAGMSVRRSPSGIALRSYYRLPHALAQELDALTLSFHHAISPGYGWIFAGPDRVFNIGVGYFQDGMRRPRTTNLRELWEWFLASCPVAAQIRKHGEALSGVRGAPLRTSLRGARIARPGLMLVGETIGTTYAFSGEGIGKAMQSGMLAAECLVQGQPNPEAAYERELQLRFRSQYDAYRAAQSWLSLPIVWKLLAHAAHRGSYVRTQMEGLLAETVHPRELLSVRGLVRAALA
jgi:menaquinone-9 beta-reductase